MDYKYLAKQAVQAKSNAHAPYSHFRVGAALLTTNNKIILGSNIESSSYSLTMCAERNAVFKAYSESERKFKAVAIAADSPDFCAPCGACRQVLSDLCGDIDVILVNPKEELKILKLSDLLPFAFGSKDLPETK